MDEVSHAEIISEIRVLSVKMDGVQGDVGEVSAALKENSTRLVAIEKWIESHDALVRFAKWAVPIALTAVGLLIAWFKLKKDA